MILCNLRNILEERGISQRCLARDIGANKNVISDLCRNDFDRVSIALLDKICDHLKIKFTDLMVYTPSTPKR